MSVAADALVGLVRDGLPAGETIGIALSGGGDSTALLHLARAAGLRVEAVTVDHRLRPGSAAEAAAVARDCAALGVPHAIRVWDHDVVKGNLMDAARQARLALILTWAQARGIGHVALGHTRDDQAETLLMGLARQAGLAGLSGMRQHWTDGGVIFHRPLLTAGREELRDWLRVRGIGWTDDPTNDNARFQRVRARRALAALAPLGISVAGLASVAGHLAQVQAALAVQVARASAHLREAAGALQVSAGLWNEPAEVQRQLVIAALVWLSGHEHQPRGADVARFIAAMQTGRDATLAGCRHRGGWLLREARVLGGPVPAGQVWDGRWVLSGDGDVRALGADGLRQCPRWRDSGLPREVVLTTPALWRDGVVVAAPLADSGATIATFLRPFHLFGLSH